MASEKYLYDTVSVSLSHLKNQVKIKGLKLNATSIYFCVGVNMNNIHGICNKWLVLESNIPEFHINRNPSVQWHFYV